MNKGNLFVIAAPSGTGKTSLVRALTTTLDQLEVSISYTTRLPRPADVCGRDYFFVTQTEFELMLAQQLFLEHANVYGYYYATSREWVTQKLAQGIDVILEIDWQGAQQIRHNVSEAILIFILPPSLLTLQERLQHRQQDVATVVDRRMAGAQEEISHYEEFDYLVVNENFDAALADLRHIVCAQRLSYSRQKAQHSVLLQQLLKK